MEVPKGLEIENNKKSILRKTIYGLVLEANLILVCGKCGMKK
jgi:hypothetical protein